MAKGKYEAWLEPDNLTRLEAWARDGLTMEQIAKKSVLAEKRSIHGSVPILTFLTP